MDKTDGRLQRSKKSRDLIISAMLDLIEEGILMPTAKQVAQTANVGIRTVFRHFNDMEGLFKEISSINAGSMKSLLNDINLSGSVDERINNIVDRRIKIYAKFKNFALAARAAKWKFKYLEKNQKNNEKIAVKKLYEIIPELKKLSEDDQHLVKINLSFDFWYSLIIQENINDAKAGLLIKKQVKNLFKL